MELLILFFKLKAKKVNFKQRLITIQANISWNLPHKSMDSSKNLKLQTVLSKNSALLLHLLLRVIKLPIMILNVTAVNIYVKVMMG